MAIFTLSAFSDEAGASLAEQVKALTENGISGTELRSNDGKNVCALTDADITEARAVFRDAGIRVTSIGSPIGKYDIDAPFSLHFNDFLRTIEVAHRLDCTRIRLFSFFTKGLPLTSVRDEVMSRMSIMLETAQKEGITLCHENEHGIYGQMPAQVKDLLTALPTLRGIFDPANYILDGADTIEGLKATLPSLAYLHIKDATKDKVIVAAGEGIGQIAKVLQMTDAAIDGECTLTVEPHLRVFSAYAQLDDRKLHTTRTFANGQESFAYAVTALRSTLTAAGFVMVNDGSYRRVH